MNAFFDARQSREPELVDQEYMGEFYLDDKVSEDAALSDAGNRSPCSSRSRTPKCAKASKRCQRNTDPRFFWPTWRGSVTRKSYTQGMFRVFLDRRSIR